MVTALRHLILVISLTGFAALCSLPSQAQHTQQGGILVLGDSISAAYGMTLESGWVALLEQRLIQHEIPLNVVNASISGDTTSGGISRLPKLLETHRPSILIIELGGNDGLRGYPIDQLRKNLLFMATAAKATGAKVLILPMEAPPNFGKRYTALFRDSFRLVAEETDALLGRFLLEDVVLVPALMQPDGIHPTAEAQQTLLDTVWPDLVGLF